MVSFLFYYLYSFMFKFILMFLFYIYITLFLYLHLYLYFLQLYHFVPLYTHIHNDIHGYKYKNVAISLFIRKIGN